MRVQLICNSASGGSTDDGEVTAALERRGATLVEDDPERVVVAGGDGTVGQGAALSARLGVPFGVIPTGTANDFARATGLPLDFDEAVALAATGTRTRSLELGEVNGRPFLNAVAAGLSPNAGRRAEPFKGALGPLAYPLGATLAAVLDPPVRCTVDADGRRVFDGAAWQVIAACTGAFGGGSEIDAAQPEDGRLDLVVIPAGRRVGLARMAVAMRRGNLAALSSTVHVRADALTIALTGGAVCNVDGELVDLGAEVRLTAERDALELVTGQ